MKMQLVYSPEAKAFVEGGDEALGYRVPQIGSFMGNGSKFILSKRAGSDLDVARNGINQQLKSAQSTIAEMLRVYMDVDTLKLEVLAEGLDGIEPFPAQGFFNSLYKAVDLLVDYDRLVLLSKRNPTVGHGTVKTIELATAAVAKCFRGPLKLMKRQSK